MKFSVSRLSQLALQSTLLLSSLDASTAFQTSLKARKLAGRGQALSRRATDAHSTVVSLIDAYDIGYSIPLTLGGVDLEMLVDLGSTDLVVQAQIKETLNTSIPLSVAYGVGNGTGFINLATLQIGDFTVYNQSYGHLDETQDLGFPDGVSGIIGIGPRFSSNIFQLLNGTTLADPPLDRIISGASSVDNFLTLLLSRVLDGNVDTANDYGFLTIGSVLDNFTDISKQPKLTMLQDPEGVIFQHWETLMDENGIYGPDGKSLPTKTIYKVGPPTQLKAMFDSGWTFPAVPDYVAEAFYGRVPNAQFNSSGPYWTIPCSYELNISFSFGGVKYPVHPLDMAVPFDLDNNTIPNNMCMGTYQPYNFTQGALNGGGILDIILGMAFLRNTYFLGNYGNYTTSFNSSTELPYIQLLSTTDPAVAHKEFVEVRLGGKDTTHSQPALLPASAVNQTGSSKSADSDAASDAASKDLQSNNSDNDSRPWYKRTSGILSIIASSIVLILVVVGIAFYIYKARARSSKVPRESAFVPDMIGKASYKPLLADAAPIASSGGDQMSHGSYGASAPYSYASGGYDEPKYEHA
ncbi:acid protease [Schizopora paradoxa]|uniref:Acid protease n=1 Tax=Schizopora paradoxa TaxID=27342 RepID=A0A0H2RND3_9AGAM|nr:acid protease [Schizopora paradoxa]